MGHGSSGLGPRGAHLVSEPLRLLLIRRQLFLPLLHVGVGLVQSGHQFGVAVLQAEKLRLQIHLTDGAERRRTRALEWSRTRERTFDATKQVLKNSYS